MDESIENKIDKSKTMRMSNFELLRIICMIFIITHHFAVHTYLSLSTPIFNFRVMNALTIGGKLGVNIYILISGYFLINSNFKIKKLIKLILEIIFYTVLIYTILSLLGYARFDITTFVRQFFPIYKSQYWFMTYYIILYLLSPFLNKLLKNCNFKEFIILISILLIYQLDTPLSSPSFNMGELIWFITLYSIAAFIRLHPNKYMNKTIVWILSFTVTFGLMFYFYTFHREYIWGMTNLVCLIASVSLFLVFRNINIKNNKIINLISSTTLGIYLIHDNVYIRENLWNNWFDVDKYALNDNFIIFAIITIMIVFIGCSIIDFIRKIFEKLILDKLIVNIEEKYIKKYDLDNTLVS